MISTKVVDTAQHIHASLQSFGVASQAPSPTGQASQALAKSSIEPFNKSGVDHAWTLAGLDEVLNHLGTALNNPSLNSQLSRGSPLDHLDDSDLRSSIKSTPTQLTSPRHLRAKGALKSPNVAGQAINRQQQRPTQGHSPNLVRQGLDQDFVSPGVDDTPQPQPARNHQRHRQPQRTFLGLDLDFVRLDLSQIKLALPDDLLITLWQWLPARCHHSLTVRSSKPYAATIAGTGQPYTNNVKTVITNLASVFNR